jgi:hypothetical protein
MVQLWCLQLYQRSVLITAAVLLLLLLPIVACCCSAAGRVCALCADPCAALPAQGTQGVSGYADAAQLAWLMHSSLMQCSIRVLRVPGFGHLACAAEQPLV